jgi:hypothetical protein
MADAIDSKPVPEMEEESEQGEMVSGNKVAMRDVYANLVGAMGDRRRVSPLFPKFPYKIHAHQPDPNSGVRHILVNDGDDVVFQIDESELANFVMAWTRDQRFNMGCDKYQISYQQALKVVADDWKSLQRNLIDPVDVLWKGEPGYTYRRLPWSREEVRGMPTPLWDEILIRLGKHATAFMGFIGSILEPKSDVQQYLYLQGSGGDGKGAIIRMLELVMGKSFKAEEIPRDGDKFWTHGLLNKRLIAFPDADARDMLKSGKIKSLLGGDTQRIEPKGRSSYSARLRCKILISANPMPDITSSPADVRRCMLMSLPKLPPNTDIGPEYEEKLWLETGSFLLKCLDVYAVLCPRHGRIPYDQEDLYEHLEATEEHFEVFADQNFEFYPEELALKPKDRPHSMTPAQLDGILHIQFKGRKQDMHDFRVWLAQKHGIRRDRWATPDNSTIRAYTGVEFKGCITQA